MASHVTVTRGVPLRCVGMATSSSQPIPPFVEHDELRRRRREIAVRIIGLLAALVVLYLFAPTLGEFVDGLPRLRDLEPLWMIGAIAFELASFACTWWLFAIALRSTKWFVISTSQLAGNALSRIVPGGAAAGVALQYRMLATGGVDAAAAGSALTASTLLQLAALAALPAVGVLFTLGGEPSANTLRATAWVGLAAFVVIVGGCALLAVSDRAIRGLGSGVQWTRNLVVRHGERMTGLSDRLLTQRNEMRRALGASWWKATFATVGNRAFDYFALLACLAAVGTGPDPGLVLLAYATAAVLAMIPITPGGLGFVEAGLSATLVLAGVSAGDAVLATLAYRMVSFWLPIPAGLVAYLWFRRVEGRQTAA
jgi:uncharacterized protein (TIRG00374 family)